MDDYDTERIRQALAQDPRVNELDVHVTVAGERLVVSGNVATPERREAVGAVVSEHADGLEVRNDVTVNDYSEPPGQEVVS